MQKEDQIITLDEMMKAIRIKVSGNFDLVVGIERGGVLPAYLASRWLDVPMETLRISFRDDAHRPLSEEPALLKGVTFKARGMKILLADDVGNTGATLRRAAMELEGAQVTTMVISGSADISLFGPHDRCIRWPWD
ncbi:MAG: phosphoribosyltransferase [Spirochaetaceae bacterium]|nr:phosphoribosyltransferase [Spirochaetaceae bacterium]